MTEPKEQLPSGAEPCPSCGRVRGVPIVYGLPAPELFDRAEAGLVVLGGCVVTENPDRWQCQDCAHRWS